MQGSPECQYFVVESTTAARTRKMLALSVALNYGIFLLKIRMGNAFNITLAFLLVAAMIVGSIYLLNKKDDNSGNSFF